MSFLYAPIPLSWIGPLVLAGPEVSDSIEVPLATFETPLWPSTERGMRVTAKAGGIQVVVIDDRMSRSVLVEAPSAARAAEVAHRLSAQRHEIASVVENTSRFARFCDLHFQIAGSLLYIRLEMTTGDASGHNMVTKAADAMLAWILAAYSDLQYVSISGNYCCDKKVSAVNGILGRGKSCVADVTIPRRYVQRYLKTTPEKIVDLNIKKNLIGSILAGGVRSANAHFANMLLGFYLATGQDAANIVEGSQGIVTAEVRQGALYFAVTIPHLIVGTVGNGKSLEFVKENLTKLGCCEERPPGANSRRLAAIAAGTILCGELSLLAAQTNPGELVRAHIELERANTL